MFGRVQVRMARAALGWSIRELAQIADLSANTISTLENGKEVSRGTLLVLRDVFEKHKVRFATDGSVSPPPEDPLHGREDTERMRPSHPLDDIVMTAGLRVALSRSGCNTVGDAENLTSDDIAANCRFTEKMLAEMRELGFLLPSRYRE